MDLAQFDGLLGIVYVEQGGRWIYLWYNGQKIWWCGPILGWTAADKIGKAIDYCRTWSGTLPNLQFVD